MFEIAVIGAGIAGLTCAQRLHQAGRQVVVIDKSRGLGGRLATRRIANTHADHGVSYLQPKSAQFQQFIAELLELGILRIWSSGIHNLSAADTVTPPTKFASCYAAPFGASAVAKHLGQGLNITGENTIVSIAPCHQGWEIHSQNSAQSITTQQVVIAIPPAQALPIAQGILDADSLQQISNINFAPSITIIAVYPSTQQSAAAQLPWQGIQSTDHPAIAWIGLDSSKQIEPPQPVLVVQSNARFAQEHFDAPDLSVVAQQLLEFATPFAPGLHTPEILQVHRWAYAFPQNPLSEKFLTAQTPAPLYFCGDWCGGNRVESAYLSGWALAEQILGTSIER